MGRSSLWREPMARIAIYALISVSLAWFATSAAAAQSCRSHGDCPFPQTCQSGLFGGYCAVPACNSDADCRNGSTCALGLCRALCARASQCLTGEACRLLEGRRVCVTRPPSSGGGTGGAGSGAGTGGSGTTPVYIEGGRCGVLRYGQVTKHVGCAPGLRCTNPNGSGTCVRLPS
jgi:hypothetical protein